MKIQENHSAWGSIESLVNTYKIMDVEGNIVPDIEAQTAVKRALTARVEFFHNNKLLKTNPFDEKGVLVDRQYFRNDFTEEGYELCRQKVPAWLKSKASSKLPPDMKILEKGLADIRGEKK